MKLKNWKGVFKMAKYRKKTLVEAEVFKPNMEDGSHFERDLPKGVNPIGFEMNDTHDTVCYPYIDTLEGRHYINPGDYIIMGVNGERWPIKSNIFYQTYEKIQDD